MSKFQTPGGTVHKMPADLQKGFGSWCQGPGCLEWHHTTGP